MKINTADEFVKAQPVDYRVKIEELRKIIKQTIPVAEELISYQVICYKYHYMLVGIGTKKDHCSFYTMNPSLLRKMEKSLHKVKHTQSTIYFPLDKELPEQLIKDIIQERIIENEQKAHFSGKL